MQDAFDLWWERNGEKLADQGARRIAFHAWHAGQDLGVPADPVQEQIQSLNRAVDFITGLLDQHHARLEDIEQQREDA